MKNDSQYKALMNKSWSTILPNHSPSSSSRMQLVHCLHTAEDTILTEHHISIYTGTTTTFFKIKKSVSS